MKLRPLGTRLVIKLVEAREETESGIILTGNAKEEPKIAEVLAIGEEILSDDKKKDELKIGDRVVFSEYAGKKVDLDGEEYIVINLSDILAVIE